MDATAALDSTPRTDKECKAAFNQMIENMQKMSAEMKATQHEIDALHIDIREQLTRLEALV